MATALKYFLFFAAGTANYIRTTPSVIRSAEAATEKPAEFVRKVRREANTDRASQALKVLSATAVRDSQFRLRKASKLQGGQFENLTSLAMDYPDIRMLLLQPGQIVIIINDVMKDEAREILKISFNNSTHKQTVGYDTQVI